MSDNVDADNSQNNIPQNPEINNRFDVVQREIDQMENFVGATHMAHIPDPVTNNDIGPEMNLGLGLEPQQQQEQQQLDHQGNEMGGVAVAEPEPIVENSQPLEAVEDHQLPDTSFDPVIMDQSSHAMMELLKVARQKQIYPFGDQGSNISEDSESEFKSSIAFYEPNKEISREVVIMNINRIGVIELLMQASLLSAEFPDIVASAKLIREILPGTVDYDGTLQIMRIEYHMPSPLSSTRGGYILRYSRKIREDMWAVVDQSLDDLFGFDETTYRRNWSGCTILELPMGHTKVTWLENVEVSNNTMHHQMLQEIVGFQFGAKRWLYAFLRQSYWVNSPAYLYDYKGNKIATLQGAKNILTLAEKMIQKYFENTSPSQHINNWVEMPGTESIMVAIKPYTSYVQGAADGKSAVVIATTAPIPVYQNELFRLLSDPKSRGKWDEVAAKYKIIEKLRINLGDGLNAGDFVCVIQFCRTDGGEPAVSYLQRSYTDSVMSYTVFTPVDVPKMKMLLKGTADPEKVDILDSGFVVFPDSTSMNSEDITGGSLLTAMFQFFDEVPDLDGFLSSDSAATARSIMEETMSLIKDAVIRGNRRTREGGSDN